MRVLEDLSCFDREDSSSSFQSRCSETTGRSVVWEPRYAAMKQHERYGQNYDPSLCVNYFCRSVTAEQTYYQHRIHQLSVTFDYIVRGVCRFRSNKNAFLAEAGEIVILPQDGDNAILAMPQDGECERYGLIIGGTLLPTLQKFYHLDGFLNIPFFNPQVMLSFFECLREAMKNGSSSEDISSLLFKFLLVLGKQHSHHDRPPLLVEVINYMDASFSEKLRINAIARQFHISVKGLNDLFQKHLQTTAYQYLITRRMTRAKELLTHRGDLRINEVASLCGYDNPLHFSTEFRRYYGRSPRAYRQIAMSSL